MTRWVARSLIVAGAAGAASAVWFSLDGGDVEALPAIGLALAWYIPGAVAIRARPDNRVARLLLAVGAFHLVAFGMATAIGYGTAVEGDWGPWIAISLAGLSYSMGFGALAVLLATYPDGAIDSRPLRLFVRIVFTVAVGSPLLAALTRPMVDVVAGPVAAPDPLPLFTLPDLFALGLLMVVGGAGFLIVRGRRATGEKRKRLAWIKGAGVLLALMIVCSPVGTSILGERGWTALFVPVAAAIPLALLAGLVRYRLLQVELYVGRTLAYAAVFMLILLLYAAATQVAGGLTNNDVLLVSLVVLAALTGAPLRHRLENLVDRWLTGGRVRGHALVRQLAESLGSSDRNTLALRAAETVAGGLEVSWVRVVMKHDVVALVGDLASNTEPQVVVPLIAGSDEIGAFECGPRHGGWSEDDLELVRLLARHAALALRTADLAAALASRVEEVTASRARLVRAEEGVRRQLERDLHDGVQQQIVALLARLELLRSLLDPESTAGEIAAIAHKQASNSLVEFRELVHGIHPPLLGDRGLVAAVESRANLMPIPVTVDVDPRLDGRRFAPAVEGAAYYVISETLTNVIKHSGADRARVVISSDETSGLLVAVTDEGSGFEPGGLGSGLRGLSDRVEALGGHLKIDSTPGVGSTISARLPQEVDIRV